MGSDGAWLGFKDLSLHLSPHPCNVLCKPALAPGEDVWGTAADFGPFLHQPGTPHRWAMSRKSLPLFSLSFPTSKMGECLYHDLHPGLASLLR